MVDCVKTTEYAVALGFFDGLHTAHLAVIENVLKFRDKGLIPAVMLFDEHPKKILSGKKIPYLLQTDIRDKKLSEKGLTALYTTFSYIKDLSPEEFVKEILSEKFSARAVVCGYNFSFGKNGEGNSDLLFEICADYGIEVKVCPEVKLDGEPVSSTRIRKLIRNGEIEEANRMLGYNFCFSSEVFTGDRRGRLLGTPTINQYLPEELIVPLFGVYASKVYFDGKEYVGVTNIGCRPTFDGENVRSETYIIGYDGNLYGKNVEINLYKFLRTEKKFEDAASLKVQIAQDVEKTKEYFSVFG